MALSDKIRRIVFDKTGKTIKVPEYTLKAFRSGIGGEKEQLSRFRNWLNSHPDSGQPLHDFLEVSDKLSEIDHEIVVSRGVIQRDDVKRVGVKIISLTDQLLSDQHLQGLAKLLNSYTEEEIITAFMKQYNRQNSDFDRGQFTHRFFTASGELVILSLREYKAKQDKINRLVNLPTDAPVPVRKTEEDEGEEIDF